DHWPDNRSRRLVRALVRWPLARTVRLAARCVPDKWASGTGAVAWAGMAPGPVPLAGRLGGGHIAPGHGPLAREGRQRDRNGRFWAWDGFLVASSLKGVVGNGPIPPARLHSCSLAKIVGS